MNEERPRRGAGTATGTAGTLTMAAMMVAYCTAIFGPFALHPIIGLPAGAIVPSTAGRP